MGEPAQLSAEDRKNALRLASELVEAVVADRSSLEVVHDYRDDPTGHPRTSYEAAEAAAIDRTKFGDLDAGDDLEMALLEISQLALWQRDELDVAAKAARLDANETRALRAWMHDGRDKVVELALEIARHWGDQGGVNGAMLDRLAELAGYPTRGYRGGQ